MSSPDALPESILRRKGSPTTAGVPQPVRALLDTGRLETVNLAEWLVADQGALAGHVLPSLGLGQVVPAIVNVLARLENPTAPRRLVAIASALGSQIAGTRALDQSVDSLQQHPSDLVRSWGCHLVGVRSDLDLKVKLDRIRPFATDRNMSVRECAWMAVRNDIAAQLDPALQWLEPFVWEADPNLRRFATEATRPRGVWCRHIAALREHPEKGLPLLEPLRADPARYVQNSVANWLNDASKSRPDWVRTVCDRWLTESPTVETRYLCRRALRTLTAAR